MKNKLLWFVVILILPSWLLASETIHANRKKVVARAPAKWFRCETDRECVHINFYCAEAVVNRKFYTLASEFYKNRNEDNKCTRKESSIAKKIPYRVFCRNKSCFREGESPFPPIFTEFRQEQESGKLFLKKSKKK